MDDRELLELAAKASGFEFMEAQIRGGFEYGFCKSGAFTGLRLADQKIWNPLEDDGDALRLAFALGMSVDASACVINFCVPDAEDSELEQEREIEFENHDVDIANLRRAIVRAAAEIGRAM